MTPALSVVTDGRPVAGKADRLSAYRSDYAEAMRMLRAGEGPLLPTLIWMADSARELKRLEGEGE